MNGRLFLVVICAASCCTPSSVTAQSTYLVGEQLDLDAAGTEGHPDTLEWFVTEPGCPDPTTATDSGWTYRLDLTKFGDWTVRLVASYLHEGEGGGLYTDEITATVSARTVVAHLESVADTPIDECVTLDGSGSRWSEDVTPTVSWLIDGPSSYTGCGGNLSCTVPADTLAAGTYTATLTLYDPDSDYGDDISVTFDMTDDTPMTDFTWTPSGTNPLYLTFSGTLSPPTISEETAFWNFGDGTGNNEYGCSFVDCLNAQHLYATDGVYEVTLTVFYTKKDWVTRTHSVQVGDPGDPPEASFSADPSSPQVMQQTTFSETGTCSGTCSYDWAFGDGTGASGASAVHRYDRSGTYTVQLTATNDYGSDAATEDVQVTDCWQPATPSVAGVLDATRACYGDQLMAEAQDGTAFLWSTGVTTNTAELPGPGDAWLTADNGDDCWGTLDFSVTPINCGDSSGDANLDGELSAADAAALIVELTDGDGTAVESSCGGDLCAPGGDVSGDGSLTGGDLDTWLTRAYSVGRAR